MRFSQNFRQNKLENANLIYIPSYKHISCQTFLLGKIRIMEFHQLSLSTENFDDSPYPYGTPKFGFIFVKRSVIGLVQITYTRLATFGCPEKLFGKNYRGLQHPSFGGRGLISDYYFLTLSLTFNCIQGTMVFNSFFCISHTIAAIFLINVFFF